MGFEFLFSLYCPMQGVAQEDKRVINEYLVENVDC